DVVGRDPLVEALAAREVPAVHDEIETQEAVDRGLERRAALEAVEFGLRPRGIVERVLHHAAGRVPRCGRVVVDRRDVPELEPDEAEKHALRVDHVPDERAGGPAFARGGPIPTVGRYGRDFRGERVAQPAVALRYLAHVVSLSPACVAVGEASYARGR